MKRHAGRRSAKRRRNRQQEAAETVRSAIAASPGTLQIADDAIAPRVAMTLWSARAVETRVFERGALAAAELVAEIAAARRELDVDPELSLWIDLEGVGDRPFIERFGAILGLHPLTLEDLVHVEARLKSEIYPEYTLLICRQLVERDDGLDDVPVGLVVAARTVISVRHCPETPFAPITTRFVVEDGRLRRSGAGYLGYALLDAIVDEWFPVVERLVDAAEELEDAVLGDLDGEVLARHAALKHRALVARRVLRPMHDTLGPLLRGESLAFASVDPAFLRDVQDHAHQSLEGLESAREILLSVVSAHQSAIAQRTNEVMRVLAVVSTIFVPLTFLVGVWGMNFERMPELTWRWGYPVALAVMAATGLGIWLTFRRRGWIE